MNMDTVTLAVGTFESAWQAEHAVADLRRAGFRQDQIAVISEDEESLAGEVMAVLVGLGLSHPEAGLYQGAADAGRTLVVVEAENRYRAAQLILERNGSSDPYSHESRPQDAGPVLVGMPLPCDPQCN
ncbi:MAG: hypothetical protein ACJ8FY_22845 [Gemmataceae bacterium]